MRILTLPVALAPFDMLSGTYPNVPLKMEEYREVTRFWIRRLVHYPKGFWECYPETDGKYFDLVKFTNGYGSKVPTVYREWKGLTIGKPNPLWVPPGFLDLEKDFFIIHLGEIVTV
jgi:hypothetical protein